MNPKYVWTKDDILKMKIMWDTSIVNQIADAVGTTVKEVAKMVQTLRHNNIALPKKGNAGENLKMVREMIAQGLL